MQVLRLLWYICLMIIPSMICAQENLIQNGSFEEYNLCPEEQNRLKQSKGWLSPFWGTPDFFARCSKTTTKKSDHPQVGVPINNWGNQEPHDGDCYAGIFATYKKDGVYGEYLETSLKERMSKGEKYYIEFWVSLADGFNRASNALGVYFSSNMVRLSREYEGQFLGDVLNDEANIITDKTNWVKISGEYIAQGNEKYVIIGNFFPFERVHFSPRLDLNNLDKDYATYYYVDDIKLYLVVDEQVKSDPINEKPAFKISKDIPVVFEKVFFETEYYELMPESGEELNKVIKYLDNHPDLFITIFGHTDNAGKARDNLVLSERRARSVVLYLINVGGIDEDRIDFKGFGGTKAVATNDTEEGRAANRRVEFMVSDNKFQDNDK